MTESPLHLLTDDELKKKTRNEKKRLRVKARKRKYIRRATCNHCGGSKHYVCVNTCARSKGGAIHRLLKRIRYYFRRVRFGRRIPINPLRLVS